MRRIRDKSQFEGLIRSLLKSDSAGSFGKLHIIALKSPDGDPEWNRKLPKLRAITEGVLEARLAPDEVYFPGPSGQYMLVFPRLGEAEGAVRAAALARQIKLRLFGETGGDLEVSSQVLPLARLKEQGSDSGSVAAMGKSLAAPPSHGIVLDALFQPVWDAQSETMVGNRETIRRQFEGRELFGPAVLFGGEEDSLAIDVNDVLRRASRVAAMDNATLFLAQFVNTQSLGDMDAILEWVAESARFHTGDLVIELAGGVAMVGRPRLRELIGAIRAEGAEVAVQTVPDMELARVLHDLGARYLCINEAQIRFAGLSPSATMALFTVVSHEVHDLGLELCLWNAKTPEEVKRSIPLGFRYFTGPMIGDTMKTLAEPRARPATLVYA